MSDGPLGNAIRQLLSRVVATQAGNAPDAFLLDRFARQKDEGAFEALVRRHGPMVLGVCRRVLHNSHDAEDAFQATFLVLVRKVDAIRRSTPLSHWLYGVAYNTARKARAAKRRAARVSPTNSGEVLEQQATTGPNGEPISELESRELQELLDAELHALPEKYRLPVILCCLEGKTKEQAARQLGWPEGTLSGRLARARDVLRNRLNRRGLGLSAGFLATALSDNALSASVPIPLVISTAKAGAAIAAGQTAAGIVSAQVIALTQGALKTMFFTKIKITVAVILAVGTLGTGAGVATYHTVVANHAGANATSEDASPDIGKKAEREQRKPVEAPNKEASDEDRMQGTWRARSVVHQENPVFRFTGNKFSGGFYSECFFKLDPTKQPKEIDLILRHGITIRGIFAFEGQTLKLSFYSGGSEDRPRGFGAEPMPDRSGHYVLQREPAEAKRKPLPAYFSKLKPEERAFAIRVPAVCIASFMTAGDKVDVIATEGSAAPRTILRGVKVLAVENVGHPDRASMKLLTLGINAKEIETVAIHVDTATLHVIAHPSKDKFRLAPNERAMNIKVANFDLVKSGDRVDVLATQGRARQAKIIAENLEVLADRGSSAEGVTLRVTPEQAEQLSFHAAIGVVRLLVRGPDK